MMVDITYISGKWDDQWDLHPLNSQLNPEHHQFSVGFTHLPGRVVMFFFFFVEGGHGVTPIYMDGLFHRTCEKNLWMITGDTQDSADLVKL
jgi:hypothetical protein